MHITMKRFAGIVGAFALLTLIAVIYDPVQADAPATEESVAQEQEKVKALLDKAVSRYRERGPRALAEIGRAGEFVEGNRYVYVMNTKGIMEASGGLSSILIGRNIADMSDYSGNYVFRSILEGALENGEGTADYHWAHPSHGRLQRKIAHYKRVDDYIFIAGYFAPRSTPEQALALLDKAVAEVKLHGPAAFDKFNRLDGGFVTDDLYVYVVGVDDLIIKAHGVNPRLIGRPAETIRDAAANNIYESVPTAPQVADSGSYEYRWRNPITGKDEHKRAHFVRVGDAYIAVGVYLDE